MLGDESCNQFTFNDWKLFKDKGTFQEEKKSTSYYSPDNKPKFSVKDYGFGSIFENATLDSCDIKLKNTLNNWIFAPKDFLFISGSTGIGKTHICCYAMRKLHENNISFDAADIKYLLEKLYLSLDTYGSHYPILNKWKEKQVIIIDDLGSSKITDWRMEVLLDLIDYRWSNELATLITSNLNMAEIKNNLGLRLSSRLSAGKIITLNGKDKRL